MSAFYFGIIWDEYTSAVECQLTKDMVAMRSNYPLLDVICCCNFNDADTILANFDIKRIASDTDKAKLYILYSVTSDKFIEAPEYATTVIERNLEVKVAKPNINPNPKNGYYLKEGDRPGPDSSPSSKPMPNNTGPANSMIKLIWG